MGSLLRSGSEGLSDLEGQNKTLREEMRPDKKGKFRWMHSNQNHPIPEFKKLLAKRESFHLEDSLHRERKIKKSKEIVERPKGKEIEGNDIYAHLERMKEKIKIERKSLKLSIESGL